MPELGIYHLSDIRTRDVTVFTDPSSMQMQDVLCITDEPAIVTYGQVRHQSPSTSVVKASDLVRFVSFRVR